MGRGLSDLQKTIRLMRGRSWGRAAWFAVLMVGGIAAWTWARPRPDPDHLLDRAWADFYSGRYDGAEDALKRRGDLVPPAATDWWLRAELAEVRGRADEAIESFGRIPDGEPFAAQARLRAGYIDLRRDRARDAEAALLHAVRLDPTLVAAHRELGYIAALQLRRAECRERMRVLSGLTTLDSPLVFVWCQNDCGIWDPKEVSSRVGRFVAADPADRQSRLAWAEALRVLGRLADAEATLAPLADTDDEALAARGRLAIDGGNSADAEALAVRGSADHPALNLLRGRLALVRGDAAGAACAFRAVLRAMRDDRDALYGLGQSLRMLGDPAAGSYLEAARPLDQLRRALIEATARRETAPMIFTCLGLACEAARLRPEARAWFVLAIARDPLDTDAQGALVRLDSPAVDRGTAH
jgi:tetratricopeptide (TPR) repeat protein